jgi:hypothetical protein
VCLQGGRVHLLTAWWLATLSSKVREGQAAGHPEMPLAPPYRIPGHLEGHAHGAARTPTRKVYATPAGLKLTRGTERAKPGVGSHGATGR